MTRPSSTSVSGGLGARLAAGGRGFPAALGGIALAGLATRVAYVLAMAPRPDEAAGREALLEEALEGRGDTFFFHQVANLLAEGHGFIDPVVYVDAGREVATALHPPAFPLLLALVSQLGGTSYLAHQLTGAALGAGAVALVGLLGRRVAGNAVGLAAAAIAALYPLFIASDGALMSEALYGPLIVGALLLAYRLHDHADRRSAAALGAVIGLAALTRSEALLLVPLLAIPMALSPGRTGVGGAAGGRDGRRVTRAGAVRAAVACLGCALVLLPWTVRNWIVFDQPVPISTHDGTVLAGANCPATYGGKDIGGWRFDCVSPRRGSNEAAEAERWRSEGLDYARDHTGELPGVLAVRVLRTWDLFQPRRQVLFAEGRAVRAEQAGVAAYFVLVALALYGAVLMRRVRQPLWILLSPVVLVTFASLLGYGLPRFRHAAEPTIVVLAAAALQDLWRRRSGSPTAPATGEERPGAVALPR